jgi:hypothetical protein
MVSVSAVPVVSKKFCALWETVRTNSAWPHSCSATTLVPRLP